MPSPYPALPQSVYDDWANAALPVVTMPAGDWYVNCKTKPLLLARSSVTVNFAGCTLHVDPADGAGDGVYPVQVAGTSKTTPKYPPSPDGVGPATRYLSRLQGAIAAGTTQLTMYPDELVTGLTAGETVLVWAGVTPSDPVECQAFVPMTVLSVAGNVITFDTPFGVDITDYGSLSGLTAATAPDLQWKVGTWGTYPSSANFSKGYGVDHGLERFVGGMVHDVTLNDPAVRLEVAPAASQPNGMWELSAIAVNRLTVRNYSLTNPCNSALHFWRCFDVLLDGYSCTGVGLSTIWGVALYIEAYAITMWGGNNYRLRNLTVQGQDIGFMNVEVEPSRIHVETLTYDVTFTAARNYASPPSVFGFHSVATPPRITDASVKTVTTGGLKPSYTTGYTLTFDGRLTFVPDMESTFIWGYQRHANLSGTVTLGGVRYGPGVVVAESKAIVNAGGAGYRVPLPVGLYTAIRFRLRGDLSNVQSIVDGFGGHYEPGCLTGAWTDVDYFGQWFYVTAGAAGLAAYLVKYLHVWPNSAGGTAAATMDLEYTYLPVYDPTLSKSRGRTGNLRAGTRGAS